MSHDWIRWVMENATGSSADRFVAWVVAAHADNATGEAFPSVARIAELTHLGRRSVIRSLRHLEAARLLGVARGGHGPGDFSRYFLGEKGCHQATLFEAAKGATESGKGATDDTLRVSPGALELSEELSEELTRVRGEPVVTNNKVPAKQDRRPAVAASVEPPGFRDFWSTYPRRIARVEAVKSYRRAVERDGPHAIVAGLAAWSAHWRAEGTDERFIPHATTWLNQSRYLDSPPAFRAAEPKSWSAVRQWRESGP